MGRRSSFLVVACTALMFAACGKVEAEPDASEGSASLSVSPASGAFGDVVEGTSSAEATFVVTNTGTAASSTLAVTLSGADADAFTIATDECGGASLDAGSSCNVLVTFTPSDIGAKTADLEIAAGGAPVTASLTGTGLALGDLRIDETTHGFGDAEVGTMTTTQIFTVTNTGQSDSGILNTSIADDSNFEVTGDGCHATILGAEQSCAFAVRFVPTAIGSQGTSVTVTANPGGSVVASVTGTGQLRLTVTPAGSGTGRVVSNPAGIDCGTTCSALFSQPNVTLTASADATMTFSGWSGGGCGGAAMCPVTLSAATTVTATFTAPDKVIFVSSTTHTGNMGGILTMDAHCQTLAANASLTGTFKAWLSSSTSTVSARHTHSPGRFVLTNGTVVANGWSGLTSGTLLAPINRTQTGAIGPAVTDSCNTIRSVWTGTFASGTGSSQTCSDWTATTGTSGMMGNYVATDSSWSFACTTTGCNIARPIICVEQ